MVQKNSNPEDFVDIAEASRISGRSHWTVRRWLGHEARLTRYKMLGRTMVNRAELIALVTPKIALPAQSPKEVIR